MPRPRDNSALAATCPDSLLGLGLLQTKPAANSDSCSTWLMLCIFKLIRSIFKWHANSPYVRGSITRKKAKLDLAWSPVNNSVYNFLNPEGVALCRVLPLVSRTQGSWHRKINETETEILKYNWRYQVRMIVCCCPHFRVLFSSF